jgi:alpha-aminoadipate carrier protein LysW
MILCPECEQRVVLRQPKLGQHVVCQECGTELVVVNIKPLELDWADYEDEDWDDDWADEEWDGEE